MNRDFEKLVGELGGDHSISDVDFLNIYRMELEMLRAETGQQPALPQKRYARTVKRALAAVAACAVLTAAVSAAVFSANPVLAADIPVVGDLVYELSPIVVPDEETAEQVRAVIQTAMENICENGFYFSEYEDGQVGWELSRETMFFAAYLKYQESMRTSELYDQGIEFESHESVSVIEITDITLNRRAFRYTATVDYRIEREGYTVGEGTVLVEIEENRNGFVITDFYCSGEDYEEYIELLREIGREVVDSRELTAEMLADINFSSGEYIRLMQRKSEWLESAEVSEEQKQMGIIAAELWERFYSASATKTMPDCSDIMELNDDTAAYYIAIAERLGRVKEDRERVAFSGDGIIIDESEDAIVIQFSVEISDKASNVIYPMNYVFGRTDYGLKVLKFEKAHDYNKNPIVNMVSLVELTMERESITKFEANELLWEQYAMGQYELPQ